MTTQQLAACTTYLQSSETDFRDSRMSSLSRHGSFGGQSAIHCSLGHLKVLFSWSGSAVVVSGVVVVAEREALVSARDAQLKPLTAADELDAHRATYGVLWIRGGGDGSGGGVAGDRCQREVHSARDAAASRRCIGTGRFVGIRLVTVAIGLDVQTLLVGVPGTDERSQPGYVGGSRWRENQGSGCQSCQCNLLHFHPVDPGKRIRSASGAEGRRFESCRAHDQKYPLTCAFANRPRCGSARKRPPSHDVVTIAAERVTGSYPNHRHGVLAAR